MKLRDFVVNSLPRVRGKKKTRGVNPPSDTSSKSRHDPPSRQQTRLSSVSRESSVERASHVAVADACWRPSPPREPQEEVALVGAMAYYTPPPNMVMSRSAEGISAHSLAVMTTHCQATDYNAPYSHMAAISETAVNYAMPKNFLFQSQHHHRHNHQHNYHYVYHHHHHHQYSPDPSPRTPLVENSQHHHHHQNRCKTNTTSRKSEPGFLRKSFASFKALRKQRSSGKEAIVVTKSKAADENGKCSVCPYPQLHAVATEVKKPADTRPVKPKRRGLKSLRKSKQNPEEQMDKTWFSDNDASNGPDHHMSDADLFYHRTTPRPRFRECSVESCMSRLYGSQDGSNGAESDYRAMDSNSLSGYESDLPKTKAGRTRSRIKTNPWLPSPQPSLNIGRRIAQCDFRESREDVMTVDDDIMSMPRSASFEHQRPNVLSSFQSSSKNRPIQRHRSLTPSDLKIALNVNKNPSDTQSSSSQSLQRTKHSRSGNDPLNDLSSTVVKIRPNSILTQASEFVILADNIEQLANNISFEYEDMLDTTLESVSTCQEDGKISIQELLTDEELNGDGKTKEAGFSNSNHTNAKAHSPDSGIGCLGSSDGDELTMASATSNEQSSLSSSGNCVTPPENYLNIVPREETKISQISDMINISPDTENSINWSEPQINLHDQNVHCHFATHLNTSINSSSSSSSSSSSAICSLSDATRSSELVIANDTPICESNYFEKTDVSRRMTQKEEPLDTNLSISQKEETLQESLQDIRESLPCRPTVDTFSNSLADTANEDFIQSPSLYGDRLFPNNFNNLHKDGINSDFSESIIQIENGKTTQLPPNIMRSEFTTPIDSPTDNWQCDADFFLHFNAGSVRAEQNNSQREDIHIGRREEKESDSMPTNGQMISSTDTIRANEKLGISTAENMSEGTADRNDNMTESNSIDWVDASVQTDFNEEEFDSWQDVSSHALGDFCDEEFDPIESTRRWLLTGNMQGSADTGYSSQPRDSQILMDDDESITSDNLNENKIAPPTFQSSDGEVTATTLLSDSATTKTNPDGPTNEKEVSNADQAIESKCSESEKRTQSEKLVHNMFSGIESQFKDIFNQLWPAQVVPEISGNKRDSSGSSTSTLISESLGGASTSDLTSREQSGFDEVTPRNSGCGNIQMQKVEEVKKHQNPLQKNTSKKKKTGSSMEPDYVNVPRRGRTNKTNGWHVSGMPGVGNKEFSVSFKKCAVQSHPYSEESVSLCHPGVGCSNSKSSLKNRSNFGSTERADYLEFLRDAPLGNTHHRRPMFLIPGFGPIDMSSAALSRLASDEWITTTEADRQGSANSKTYAHIYGLDSNKSSQARTRIAEGRSVARPQPIYDKESRVSKTGSYSDKRHHVDQEMPKSSRNVLPEKPKRKNPRAIQTKPCPARTQWTYSPLSGQLEDVRHTGNSVHVTKTSSHHTRTYPDNSTRGIVERVWQLQREKDLIYSQLREVQQEELSRQRQQLQHHRNVHSQRKDILLETLRELKDSLEEQSRQLNMKCNKDVYI